MPIPASVTPETLARTRKRQLAAGEPPRYPGTCTRLTEAERAEKRQQGQPEVLRFRIDKNAEIHFTDYVRGKQSFRGADLGDFIIRKQDNTPTFMFGNAVDDALMEVSLVMRGEDHLTNTPRQILILKALSLPIPEYAHLSIILGSDGAPLSKRNGSVSFDQLISEGYYPLAICNYMARLGHVYESHDLLSLDQLAVSFNLNKLVTSASRYDSSQLSYWQKRTIESLDSKSLADWLAPVIAASCKDYPEEDLIAFLRSNIVFPQDAVPWLAMLKDPLVYSKEATAIIEQTETTFFNIASEVMKQSGDWQKMTSELKTTGVKGKQLFLPLRAALTGNTTGPELLELVALIGSDRASERLAQAASVSSK